MIGIIEGHNEADFFELLSASNVNARLIMMNFECYSTIKSSTVFYMQEKCLAIMLQGKKAYLCGEVCDEQELLAFLTMNGCTEVQGAQLAIAKPRCKKMYEMIHYEPTAAPCPEAAKARAQNSSMVFGEIGENSPLTVLTYAKFLEENGVIDPAGFDDTYTDMCIKRNANFARFYFLSQAQTLRCTAALITFSSSEQYITAVCTTSASRGRGAATALISVILGENAGKRTYVIVDEDHVLFYKKQCFNVSQEIPRYKL